MNKPTRTTKFSLMDIAVLKALYNARYSIRLEKMLLGFELLPVRSSYDPNCSITPEFRKDVLKSLAYLLANEWIVITYRNRTKNLDSAQFALVWNDRPNVLAEITAYFDRIAV